MITDESKIKEELLQQRYGEDSIPKNILWNNQIKALISHKSVRNYLNEPLEDGSIETIVAAAQSASNSSNLNQWSVVAVTDSKLKAEIGRISRIGSKFGMGNPYIEQAPVVLMWVADVSRNHEIARLGNGTAEIHEYTDALIMASIDTAIAAQNAVIAAESLGLGVVYLGVMRNNAKEIAAALKLPKYSYVVFGMALGKPDREKESSIRPRLSQKAVLHYNGYDSSVWKEELEIYEDAFRKFREGSNMTQKTWQDSVSFSANDKSYMEGRENLRQTLEEQGFLLR